VYKLVIVRIDIPAGSSSKLPRDGTVSHPHALYIWSNHCSPVARRQHQTGMYALHSVSFVTFL